MRRAPWVATQNDAHARTTAFRLLCLALVIKSVGPGAVNFATNPHPLPGLDHAVKFSHLAELVSALGSALVLLVSAIVVDRYGRTNLYISGGVAMLLILAVFTQFRMSDDPLKFGSVAAQVSLLAVVLAVCALRPSLNDLGVIGVAGCVVAAYSAILYVVRPYNALYFISGSASLAPEKAIVRDIVIAGPMSHSNTLGSFLALTFPFIGLWHSRRLRLLGYCVILAVIPLTASRTALIAVGVLTAFVVLRAVALPFRARTAGAIILTGVGTLLVYLPLAITDPTAFSTRVSTWQDALNAWRSSGSLLLGVGPYWSGALASDTGYAPRTTSGHNLFVHWGVTGGVLMIAVGTVLLVILSRKALAIDGERVFPVATGYVLALLTVSITEFALSFTITSQLFVGTGLAMTALLNVREQPDHGGALRTHSTHTVGVRPR
ncbi:MAG: hypothetical protein K1X67_01665 [Fimbriimonadaceae bacterium]|nr:hypothetical protein [Fimbriimonadaceae bacterium]